MFKKEIAKVLKKHIKLKESEILSILEIPPDHSLGDYAFPCFSLSKSLKKAPNAISLDLASKIRPDNIISKAESKGMYLNIFIKNKVHFSIIPKILKEKAKFGSNKSLKKTIVIEFPSPNTNKPLHLGHLRNIFLGQSIARMLAFSGANVKITNLNNDRGIHICKSMLAYKCWGRNRKPNKKPDHFVGDFYVLYEQKSTKKLESELKEMLQKWEAKDKNTLKLWELMNSWAIEGFNQTYKRLGLKFNKVYNESRHYDKGKRVVEKGIKKGLFYKDEEGSVVANLDSYNLGKKILLRPDGTSLYITQDIYLAELKYKDFKFHSSFVIVGNEQKLHFQQLSKILELLGYKWAGDYSYILHGMVYLPHGRMKSREGKVVDADDLLDRVLSLAKKEVSSRHKLLKNELEKRSRFISLAALRFFILKYDPQKDFVFNPEESLSFEGETGPYIQYVHARISSILKKAKIPVKAQYSLLEEDKEIALVKVLSKFPEHIIESSKNHKPSIIANYLLELCQNFNSFYASIPVLKADKSVMDARLHLISAVQQVVSNGLKLLAIEAPEEM